MRKIVLILSVLFLFGCSNGSDNSEIPTITKSSSDEKKEVIVNASLNIEDIEINIVKVTANVNVIKNNSDAIVIAWLHPITSEAERYIGEDVDVTDSYTKTVKYSFQESTGGYSTHYFYLDVVICNKDYTNSYSNRRLMAVASQKKSENKYFDSVNLNYSF